MVANVGSRLRFLIFGSPATSVLALLCMKKVLINADMLATKENNDLFFTMYRCLCAFSEQIDLQLRKSRMTLTVLTAPSVDCTLVLNHGPTLQTKTLVHKADGNGKESFCR